MTTTSSPATRTDVFDLLAGQGMEVTGVATVTDPAELDVKLALSPAEQCEICDGRNSGLYSSGGCDDPDCDSHCN